MKLLTDKRDLGLADGLIIFLFALYFVRKTVFEWGILTRFDLMVITLAFLYLVTIVIHSFRTSKEVSEDNLEPII